MRRLSFCVGSVVVALAFPGGAAAASAPGVLTQATSSSGCTVDVGTSPIPSNCFFPGRAMADMRSVVVSPDGKNVYASASGSDAVAIFDRDSTGIDQKEGGAGCIVNGPSADITPCDNTGRAINGAGQVAISPDGRNVYVATDLSNAIA